MAEVKCSAETN